MAVLYSTLQFNQADAQAVMVAVLLLSTLQKPTPQFNLVAAAQAVAVLVVAAQAVAVLVVAAQAVAAQLVQPLQVGHAVACVKDHPLDVRGSPATEEWAWA